MDAGVTVPVATKTAKKPKIKIETFVCCDCGIEKTEEPLIDKSKYKWCWDCLSCGADPATRYVTESV
jgi:transcription elongation factor Elf1